MSDETDDKSAVAEAKRLLGEWPVTVKLGTPVEFGKETIEELVFQKGNFGILKGMNIPTDRFPNLDELMTIASRLCGKSLKVIEMLDPDDAAAVSDVATLFFARCRGAGRRI
jgi:hypothetical protein